LAVAMCVVSGNLLTIIAFFKFKTLQDATNCLICNQSFADVMQITVTWVYAYCTYIPSGKAFISVNKYPCLIYLWASSTTLISSFVNIMAISIERLIAITLPFINRNPHKKKAILLWIIAVWVGIILFTSLPTLGVNNWRSERACNVYFVYTETFLMYCTFIPMFVILALTALLNIIIGISVLRRRLRRAKVGPGGQELTQAKKSANLKITLMLLMVVSAFYVCWMPYLSITCYSLFNPLLYAAKPNLAIVHEFSKVLMMVNGALNPFIYANRNPQFKKAFK
ncbi:hypothetical protein CAPTEDRAFT_75714, partial [Capitella teleta]